MLAGCGGGHGSAIRVDVKVGWAPMVHRHNESFTLRCEPSGGTLPYAARICRDIAAHPRAMLRAAPARSVCGGMVAGPNLTVIAHRGRSMSTLTGQPFCDWPGGIPLGVYWAASQHDTRTLGMAESRLRCDDDPLLLARPTPNQSVFACTHGFWTPHNERLIRIAERVWPLRVLQPRRLFPRDVGVLPCQITVSGPSTREVAGHCGVIVRNAWLTPTVSFVEAWPGLSTARSRHRWVVRISNGKPRLVAQSGGAVPQFLE